MATTSSPESSSEETVKEKPRVTRRQFITYAGIAGTALAIGGAGGAVLTRIFPDGQTQTFTTYPQMRIAHLSDLQEGKTIVFDYPFQGQSSALMQLGTPALDGVGPHGDIVAFSTLCVHMGCSLAGRYQSEHKVLGPCPCHLSTYDLALGGQPVIGVATENLPQIELTVDPNGNIFAEGVWGLIYGFENNLHQR